MSNDSPYFRCPDEERFYPFEILALRTLKHQLFRAVVFAFNELSGDQADVLKPGLQKVVRIASTCLEHCRKHFLRSLQLYGDQADALKPGLHIKSRSSFKKNSSVEPTC